MCVLLPTGNIYKVNVKIITTILLVAFIILDLFFSNRLNPRIVLMSIYGIVLILLSWLMAAIRSVEFLSSFSHLMAFISVIVIIISVEYSIKNKFLNYRSYLLAVLTIFSIYSFLKVLLAALFVLNIVNAMDILQLVNDIFVYGGIAASDDVATRINLPIDFLAPGIIFFTINHKSFDVKIPIIVKYSILLIVILCVVVSYSRFLWGISFVAFVFSLLCALYVRGVVVTKKSLLYSFIFLVIFLIIIFASYDTIIQTIAIRYTGSYADDSDSYRVLMANALYPMFYSNPIFGNGLGAYSSELIRFENAKWNYELEWLASLMQFGLFGMLNVTAVLFALIIRINRSLKLISLGITCVLILFLSVAFFNCFLLTSSAGVVISQIIVMGDCYTETSKNCKI